MLNITAVKTEINGGPESHQGLAPFQIVLAREQFPRKLSNTFSHRNHKARHQTQISFTVTCPLI